MVKLVGVSAEMKRLRQHVKKFEQEAVVVLRSAAFTVLRELFARTPVWSGETVRNYAVGVGRSPSGGTRSALGTGEPGDTNSMRPIPAGEPRRAVNEASALAEATPVLMQMNKLQTVYFTNLVGSEKWGLIDGGSAPTPALARNPGGVEKIATMNARARLGGKFK